VKNAARSVWNEALSRIRITGGTEEQRTVFYTPLYRSLLHMVNIAENGKYFSGYDGRVHETDGIDFYTLDNLWDSYRCLHPLQLLLEPGSWQRGWTLCSPSNTADPNTGFWPNSLTQQGSSANSVKATNRLFTSPIYTITPEHPGKPNAK
jgi:putative alpha-1,2-mannosidase